MARLYGRLLCEKYRLLRIPALSLRAKEKPRIGAVKGLLYARSYGL